MNSLLRDLFRGFDQEHIAYCVMRDAQHLDSDVSEVDVLVQASQLARCAELLLQLGFLPLPSAGYAPHRFFVAYERHSDRWIKLDIVSQVAYGAPVPVLYTDLAAGCLRHRQRDGDVYVPSPEYELITLLLHCILDKGRFAEARIQRIQTLRHQVGHESLMTSLLRAYWHPAMSWSALTQQIDAGAWEKLLVAGEAIPARQRGRQRIGAAWRTVYARTQRKLNRWITGNSPRVIRVAILAPDGAGKSTLVKTIGDTYAFPVRRFYMGLYSRQASILHRIDLPGIGFAARIVSLWWRCLLAGYHQARRRLILFDRYTYDSLLPSPRSQSRSSHWRRWITARACPAPDLVIVLDAPGDLLYARKGEHSPGYLEQQRQGYLALTRSLPQAVVVDATHDADHVRREVTALIWDAQVRRHRRAIKSQVEQAVIP